MQLIIKQIDTVFGTLFALSQAKKGEKMSAINTESKKGTINVSAILIPEITTTKAAAVMRLLENDEYSFMDSFPVNLLVIFLLPQLPSL
ncbi:MAG: hypothetical protein ACJA2R_000191 [Saprospiraceae bacterium]|jgi:hypothetical protein|tara:strand:- start:3548 stop:3814 length:267 start_codon:yes stop_codon:yes gene_type:complete